MAHTCADQLIFGSAEHVGSRLGRDDPSRGAILDLPALRTLATGWYANRLCREYRRRTPGEAAALFQDIGRTGEFWDTGA